MRASLFCKPVTASAITAFVVFTGTPAFAAGQPAKFDPATGLNTANLEWFSNGLAYYALLAALVGLLVSASLWALGSKGQNPGTELTGKKGIILCCTAAFFIGALPAMISYLERQAKQLDTNGITAASPISGRPTVLAPPPVDDVDQFKRGSVLPDRPESGPPLRPEVVEERRAELDEIFNRNPVTGQPYNTPSAPASASPAPLPPGAPSAGAPYSPGYGPGGKTAPAPAPAPGAPYRPGAGPRPLPVFTPDS